jgi:hypothetical protein
MVQVPLERYEAGEEAWQHLVGDAGIEVATSRVKSALSEASQLHSPEPANLPELRFRALLTDRVREARFRRVRAG